MTQPHFPRVQRGDWSISAELVNAHSRALEALRDPTLPDGEDFLGNPVQAPAGLESFLARITAKDGSTPPAYSWIRIEETGSGVVTNHPDGSAAAGGPSYATGGYAAYEESGNAAVPTDGSAIVRLFAAHGVQAWRFHWAASTGGGGPGTITVQEVDLAPTLTGISTLRFDQTDGFVVSQPAAGIARIDMAGATYSQAGTVYPGSQVWQGDKGIERDADSFGGDYGFYLKNTGVDGGNVGFVILLADSTSGYTTAAYRAALTFSSSLGAVSLVGDMVDGRLVIDLGEKFPSGRYELAVRGDDNQLHNGGSATVGGMTFVKGLYISGAPTTTDSAVWRFSSTVPSSPTDPSSGKLTLNNSSGPSATSICISDLTDAGTDVSSYLSSLQAGDVVYLQDQSDASKWLRYNLTTAAVDHTYWHELGVSYVSGPGGSITNNSPLLVTLTRTGGGGGGAGYTDAQAQDAMAAAFAAGTHSGITFSYNTTTNAMSATVTAGGVGTVTSVAAGTGLTASPSPITGAGTLSLVVPVTVANGGTGATTASAALTALGGVPTTRPLPT